jgi:hypothetical protein
LWIYNGGYDISRFKGGRNRVTPFPGGRDRIYDITYRSAFVGGGALIYVEVKGNNSTYHTRQRDADREWRRQGHRVEFYRIRGIPLYKQVRVCIRNCPVPV